MTIQFRSRIKTAFDYGDSAGATGACCLPDGTKVYGDTITVSECNRQNGYFREGDPDLLQCPDRGLTGCCCSCANIRNQEGDFDNLLFESGNIFEEGSNYYNLPSGDDVDEIGLKDNVTQCECFKTRGRWFYGKCNEMNSVETLCGNWTDSEKYDVRIPAACCHGNTSDEQLSCTNVCTLEECSDLAIIDDENFGYSLFNGKESGGAGFLCEDSPLGDNYNCSTEAIQRSSSQSTSSGKSNDLSLQKFPCLELDTVDGELIHKCSMKTPSKCFSSRGYMYPRKTNKIETCSDAVSYVPIRGSGGSRIQPPTTSRNNMPEIGDPFQGGIYYGIFEPGKSSILRKSSNPKGIEKASYSGSGQKNKKWALILSSFIYDPFNSAPQKYRANNISEPKLSVPTSLFDGFYNTYGDGVKYNGYYSELFENIRNMVYNGFVGWYVPSIDELSFIYARNHSGTIESIQGVGKRALSLGLRSGWGSGYLPKQIISNIVMSSSFVSPENNLNMKYGIYAQNMKRDKTYTTQTSGGQIKILRRDVPLYVPLVQRIYIND